MVKFLVLAAALLATVFGSPIQSTDFRVHFTLDEEWYTIPTVDGRLELMSREQVVNHILLKPSTRFSADTGTLFNLHTRTNPEGVRIQLDNEESLKLAGFNTANPVRFTMHGWKGDTTSDVNAVNQFLEAGDFNHIVVDWSAGAGTLNYIDARNRVPDVAKFVGRMAGFLVESGSSWDQIYMIGHSLGGQMAGLVGQYLEEGQIEACIALDPAGPLFSESDPNERTSPDDCKYVEVIHTNGGLLGFTSPIGHSDFYPNGGKSQPGCGVDLVGSCAHARAPMFFRESLVTKYPFTGIQCSGAVGTVTSGKCEPTGNTSTMMGDPVNFNAEGLYYLETAKESPFVLPVGLVDPEIY